MQEEASGRSEQDLHPYPGYIRFKAIPFAVFFVAYPLFSAQNIFKYLIALPVIILFCYIAQRDWRLFRPIRTSNEGVHATTIEAGSGGVRLHDYHLVEWARIAKPKWLTRKEATKRLSFSGNFKKGVAFTISDIEELVILEEVKRYEALVELIEGKTV